MGVGAGGLFAVVLAALYFKGRGASGHTPRAVLASPNPGQQETAAKQVASYNPGFVNAF